MKFKNSYILIVIAIFLLISIGSVCASENIAEDSDVQSSDDGTNVVLSDTDENVPDDTTQEKINTTVEPEKNSYEFKEDSNKTISVHVKDNKTNNHIDINKSDISISNGDKLISFEYNSSIITITEKLPTGNYNLTINYLGNATYVNSSSVISVKIYGNNTIETVTSVICNGANIEIPVKIYDQVEYIEAIQNNFNLTLVYTNESGNPANLTISNFKVEDGKIKFTSPVELINARLIINYANATEPKTVAIKVSTEVKAETDKEKFKSEEIKNISINITSGKGNLNVNKTDLKVFDNGKEITDFTFNNSNLTVNLGVGIHNLTIVYLGNETYNGNSTNITIGVSGNNTINIPEYVVSDGKTVEIPVTVFDGVENINVTQFTLNLTYTNKTGNETSIIIDSYEVKDGIIKFNVENEWIKANVNINCVNSTGAKTANIYLASSVNATAENKYRENKTNNITITVKDNNGNRLTINKNDLEVYDNGNKINFDFNSTTSILNVKLAIGVHNLTIVYKGNDTFNSSSTTIEQKVYGDLRFEPEAFVVLNEDKTVTIFLNLNDGADLLSEVNKTKLTVKVISSTGNTTINLDEITLNDQNITFTIDNAFEKASVYLEYDNLNATVNVKVNTKIETESEFSFGESEDKNITIKITGDNGYSINITQNNIQILNNGKAVKFTVNNSVIIITDALKFGVYNLTIKYLGDNTFIESNKTVQLTVYGINATSSVNVNSTKNGNVKVDIINGNETIPISANDLTINVTYKDGNDTKNITATIVKYENGVLYFTLENGNFTTATLTIKYNNTEVNVTLKRIYNAKIEIVNNVNEYKTGNFTFRLVDIDDGSNISGKSIKLTTVGNIRAGFTATTDKNGIATFRTINLYEFNNNGENGAISLSQIELDVGNHTVDIEKDSSDVIATKVTTNLTVTQGHFKIVVNPYKEYYGTDKPVTVTVTNSLGEAVPGVIVKLTIDKVSGEYYLYTNTSGVGRISIYNTATKSGLVGGDYVFTVSNNDTTNIEKTSSKGTVTVVKIPVVINGKDVTVYYNSGTTSTIKVTKNGKAVSGVYLLVRLYTTSTKYNDYLFQTNSKGEVSFSASLTVGKHKMIVTSADNRYDAKQVTKTITVKKASAKITAKKVTDYYKGVKSFTVKVTNTKNGKAIYDAKVNIKIYISSNRYYNYNGNTGSNGQLKLLLNTLNPGTYKVVVTGADSKDFSAKKVTSKIVIKKAPTKLTPKKLTAKKGAKKYFKVTVKNKKTKKVISGVKIKIKVYTGKKAKTYTVKTNSKGVAQISTKSLKVGSHKVVVSSANKYCVAKTAKSTIKIKK